MVFKLGLPMIRTMESKLVEPQEQGNDYYRFILSSEIYLIIST